MKKKEAKKTKIYPEYLSKINNELRSIRMKIAEMKDKIVNGKGIDPVELLQIEKRVEEIEKELACYRKQKSIT